MLRVDGAIPHDTLMSADDEELDLMWDSFVEYCEARDAAMKRQQEAHRGR